MSKLELHDLWINYNNNSSSRPDKNFGAWNDIQITQLYGFQSEEPVSPDFLVFPLQEEFPIVSAEDKCIAVPFIVVGY